MVRQIGLVAVCFFAFIVVTFAYRLDNVNQDMSDDQRSDSREEDPVRSFRIQNNANVRNIEEESSNNRALGIHLHCGKDCQYCKDACARTLTGKELKYCVVACKVGGAIGGGVDPS